MTTSKTMNNTAEIGAQRSMCEMIVIIKQFLNLLIICHQQARTHNMRENERTGSRSAFSDGGEEEEFHWGVRKFALVHLHHSPKLFFLTRVDGLSVVEDKKSFVGRGEEGDEWRVAKEGN